LLPFPSSRQRRPLNIRAHGVIEKWHRENNYVSPNEKDVRKLRVGRDACLTDRAIYRVQTWNGLWADFVLAEPELAGLVPS
jgi:hypothetical protein